MQVYEAPLRDMKFVLHELHQDDGFGGLEIGRAHVELQSHSDLVCRLLLEIGRASCRERV